MERGKDKMSKDEKGCLWDLLDLIRFNQLFSF